MSPPSWYLPTGDDPVAPVSRDAQPGWYLGDAPTDDGEPPRRYVATRSFLGRDPYIGVIDIIEGKTFVAPGSHVLREFPECFAPAASRMVRRAEEDKRGIEYVVRGPAETGQPLRPQLVVKETPR